MPRPHDPPFRIADVEIPNRVAARPARRDRQLVRAAAGSPSRRRARGLGDGLQLRARPSQSAHDRGDAADPSRRGAGRDPALRPRSRRDARGGGDRRRRGTRSDRPQHGLPGAEGAQDRSGGGAAARARARGRRRAGRGRGVGAAGDGQASLRDRPRRPVRGRPRPPPGRGRGRGGDHASPPLGEGPSQRLGRLRARRPAGRGARRAGDRLRRRPHRGHRSACIRAVRRVGGDGRARVARQPVDLRAAGRPCGPTRRGTRRSSPS